MRTRYRKSGEEFIPGIALPVVIDNVSYHLTEIVVYKDGLIDCWGLIDFPTFESKIRTGWVKTSIPDGSELSAFPLGALKVEKFYARRSEEELLIEVKDLIEKLNDRPDSGTRCRETFSVYMKDPSVGNKEHLRIAYESIPIHNRQFVLGDMEVDDIPIRVILYGAEEFQKSRKAQLQEKVIREQFLRGLI